MSRPVALALLRADDPCPFDLCDGSGLRYDDATNTAYDCRCRAQRIALRNARSLSAVIPRRYRDVSFDRPPVTEMDPTIVAATRRLADGDGVVAAVMRELRQASAEPPVEEHEGEEPREGADGSCSGANLSKEEVGS